MRAPGTSQKRCMGLELGAGRRLLALDARAGAIAGVLRMEQGVVVSTVELEVAQFGRAAVGPVGSAWGAVSASPPTRFPRPPARTGRAAFTASGSPRALASSGCAWPRPGAGDRGTSISVANDLDRRRVEERNPTFFRSPSVVWVVAFPEPLPASTRVFTSHPPAYPEPRVVAEVGERVPRRSMPEVVGPALQYRVQMSE
jgi:hypothetical protein